MPLLRKRQPRPSRVARIPPGGRAIVLSDLHGHVGDWRAFLAASRVKQRLLDGEDLWLIVTGDVPDVARHRSVDPTVPEDGDAVILEELIQLKAELGDRAERVVYLEGNHDFHLLRIAREVAAFAANAEVDEGELPELEPAWVEEYCLHYQAAYGKRIFENNVAPYDMIRRVRPEHARFLDACPVVACCEEAGLVVTHAGPPRMNGWKPKALRRAIEQASRAAMRGLDAEDYYASPYHQLLNSRFRNGDYDVQDLEGFLDLFGGGILVTGHTPHPYLVDFDRQRPVDGCGFRDGLGFVGERQVVLCSSFGAFHPALKRYLELDLSGRYERVGDLFEGPPCAHPIFPLGMPPPDVGALPGAEALFDRLR